MKKETPPKYAQGDKVYSSMNPEDVLTIKGTPSWNGYNWMYAFNEIDMRCGEGYLRLEVAVDLFVIIPPSI